MKILHVCKVYDSFKDGNQIHMKMLSENLVKLGDYVQVFSMRKRESLIKIDNLREKRRYFKEKINGVSVRRFSQHEFLHNLIFKFMPHKIRGGYKLEKLIFGQNLEAISQGPFCPEIVFDIVKAKPDLIMCLNMSGTLPYFCFLARKILKIPLVIIPCLHTWQEYVENEVNYSILKSASMIIALTEFEKKFLINKGMDEKMISVIGAGVDAVEVDDSKGQKFREKYNIGSVPIVLFVGRRENHKGVNVLIDAMTLVRKEIPSAILVLAGKASIFDKEFYEKYEALDSEDRNKTLILEDFTEEDKAGFYSACDIFAMPSITDSFGIVYLEAWIHEKPVIACKNTSQETLIEHGKDGYLVEYGNVEETAVFIIDLLKDAYKRSMFGKNGKLKVQSNYTWDIVVDKVRAIYCEIVKISS